MKERSYNAQAESALLSTEMTSPPKWTYARRDKNGRQYPQTIAHRGYKAKHPENTMGSFHGAVTAGAHAIETDIHLSKDRVVVLSHDADLKRCFGREEKIIDCYWEYLSSYRTLKAPHEPMPRLKDLLEYLASPLRDHVWLLLDIKLDNNADDVINLIAKTIEETNPSPNRPWRERILLGCWAVNFIPLCATYLPKFPITHIGVSTPYARQFLTFPHVSFNMLKETLIGPFGAKFIHDARALGRPMYDWTVNDDVTMKWSIKEELDGVITDDPKRFQEVCHDWENGKREIKITGRMWFHILRFNFWVFIFGNIYLWKYRKADERRERKKRMQR